MVAPSKKRYMQSIAKAGCLSTSTPRGKVTLVHKFSSKPQVTSKLEEIHQKGIVERIFWPPHASKYSQIKQPATAFGSKACLACLHSSLCRTNAVELELLSTLSTLFRYRFCSTDSQHEHNLLYKNGIDGCSGIVLSFRLRTGTETSDTRPTSKNEAPARLSESRVMLAATTS